MIIDGKFIYKEKLDLDLLNKNIEVKKMKIN